MSISDLFIFPDLFLYFFKKNLLLHFFLLHIFFKASSRPFAIQRTNFQQILRLVQLQGLSTNNGKQPLTKSMWNLYETLAKSKQNFYTILVNPNCPQYLPTNPINMKEIKNKLWNKCTRHSKQTSNKPWNMYDASIAKGQRRKWASKGEAVGGRVNK